MPFVQVLLADDDRLSRHLLAHSLQRWGYHVIQAEDGAQASRILAAPGAPRLAILDWMMPGMTGPALCREVRRARREPYTYVLLLTARNERKDIIEGLDSGADDYLTKPFDAQELQVRLRAGRRILDLEAELVAARESLRVQATHDPLTGTWNRLAILEALNRELARGARERTALAIVMADLDRFKRINDRHGHLAGDAVLREAARRMSACLRPYDQVGRYGGEEFLVLLPAAPGDNAVHLAERIRAAVGEQPIDACGTPVRATLSLGVTVSFGGAGSPEDLIQSADQALYRAKQNGRNRVESAEAPPQNPLSALAPDLAAAGGPLRNG
jgi:two-component system cell cycle response regulator